MDVRGRIRALWLLAVFLLAQGGSLFALGWNDVMACCQRGRHACCKRKPAGDVPSVRAGHACTMCVGVPATGAAEGVAAEPGNVETGWAGAGEIIVAAGLDPVWAERGARFARPPPGLSFS